MGRVLTNNTTLSYAREATVGVLPAEPVWHQVEPNTIGAFGADIKTVARRPISRSRQLRKGTIVDLDSKVEYESDFTIDAFVDFAESFVYSAAANSNLVFPVANAATNAYTIPAATASQGGKMQYVASGHATLLYARGYAILANNGLKVLTGDVDSTGTSIPVTGQGVVTETAPVNAIVEVAGVRGKLSDLSIVVTGTTAVITSAADFAGATGFNTLGIVNGQEIHVGGLLAANQFTGSYGYARVTGQTAGTLTLDKISPTLITAAGTGDTVDILFGRFIRNVPTDAEATDSNYQEYSHTFEGVFTDLGGVGIPKYLYPAGNYANEITINLPLADKATIGYAFLGTTTPVFTTVRANNAEVATTPVRTTALNTSSDIASISTDVLTSVVCFQSLTFKLSNSVSPEKCLGVLGASYMNAGLFEVTMDGQALFTDSALNSAIRNNTTVTFQTILRANSGLDGGVTIDIPAMTLGGGKFDFPVDKSVLINLTGTAFADPVLGTSIGISIFPILPAPV